MAFYGAGQPVYGQPGYGQQFQQQFPNMSVSVQYGYTQYQPPTTASVTDNTAHGKWDAEGYYQLHPEARGQDSFAHFKATGKADTKFACTVNGARYVGWFDPNGYLKCHSDLAARGITDAWKHYCDEGHAQYRDVAMAFTPGQGQQQGVNPVTATTAHGRFDNEGYYQLHPETRGQDAFQHFKANGKAETKIAVNVNGIRYVGVFDPNTYLNANPDLRARGVSDGWQHWSTEGHLQGRDCGVSFPAGQGQQQPSYNQYQQQVQYTQTSNQVTSTTAHGPFDYEGYYQLYPNVRGQDAFRHYVATGKAETRIAVNVAGVRYIGVFDPNTYMKAYPDLSQRGISDGWKHWSTEGHLQGRDCGISFPAGQGAQQGAPAITANSAHGKWDAEGYYQLYPHVRGQDAFAHFKATGKADTKFAIIVNGNRYIGCFNPNGYLDANPDLRAQGISDGWAHYSQQGYNQYRDVSISF